MRSTRLLLALAYLTIHPTNASAETPCLIPGRGHFRVSVDAGGLFGAFAHDHLIEAQKIEN